MKEMAREETQTERKGWGGVGMKTGNEKIRRELEQSTSTGEEGKQQGGNSGTRSEKRKGATSLREGAKAGRVGGP